MTASSAADRGRAKGNYSRIAARVDAEPLVVHSRWTLTRLTSGERYEAALRVMVRRAVRRGDVI